jgi:hypothetical protein
VPALLAFLGARLAGAETAVAPRRLRGRRALRQSSARRPVWRPQRCVGRRRGGPRACAGALPHRAAVHTLSCSLCSARAAACAASLPRSHAAAVAQLRHRAAAALTLASALPLCARSMLEALRTGPRRATAAAGPAALAAAVAVAAAAAALE